MALKVAIEIRRKFTVDCSYDKVFDILADVPVSGSHFPRVDRIVDLGDNAFRWEMAKIGIDKYSIQTVYACKYTDNKEEGWVKWVPVAAGNMAIEGSWKIKQTGDKVAIEFHNKGDLKLPLPSLAKFIVAPIVNKEFEGMIDKYILNLQKTFSRDNGS